MTTAWGEVPLGEVTEFVRGITFKPADVEPLGTPGSIACMRTANVQAELDLEDVWAVPEKFCRRDEQRLRRGDLLVSTANSWNLVGKCAWVGDLPWPSTFGGFVSALRSASPDLDPRYLYRWFASPRIQATLRSYGRRTTSISNLSLDQCRAMRMPLPPIEEQRRIAAVLDQADGLRAKRQTSLALLDSLKRYAFDEICGASAGPTMRLADLLAMPLRNGISPSTRGTVAATVLTLSAVTGSSFDPTATKIATFATMPPAEKRVSEADLLICRGNGNLGLVGKGYFPRHSSDVAFPDTVIAARIDRSRVEPAYLEHVWGTQRVRSQIESLARTTNGTYKVNQTMLESIELPAASLEHQRRFAMVVAALDAQRERARASSAATDSLFSSLQHRAFAGQL